MSMQETEPWRGPGDDKLTSCSGACTGTSCNKISWNNEKIAAFAPIPSAKEITATIVTNGLFKKVRSASFKFILLILPTEGLAATRAACSTLNEHCGSFVQNWYAATPESWRRSVSAKNANPC